MTISENFINYMVINGIMEKARFAEYYINKSVYLELYNCLNKLINLDERKDLNENLQNCLIEIDKRHLPQIIILKENLMKVKLINKDYTDNNLKKLEDFYNYEKQKIYDVIRIKKLELQMQEKDEKISLLEKEINEIKSLLSSKSNSKKDIKIQSF